MPTNDTIAEMRQRFPAVDLKLEHEKFVNHFSAQPGAKGRKSNWDMTFRNWIIRAAEQTRSVPGNQPPTQTAYDRKKDQNRTVFEALGADKPKELT
ncbi:hypothetical protein BMG05_19810 [Mycobacterium malmoense]|nr:hypothetical protein BMG05_19810 [Mycobacterium malmoense]